MEFSVLHLLAVLLEDEREDYGYLFMDLFSRFERPREGYRILARCKWL